MKSAEIYLIEKAENECGLPSQYKMIGSDVFSINWNGSLAYKVAELSETQLSDLMSGKWVQDVPHIYLPSQEKWRKGIKYRFRLQTIQHPQ